METSKRARRITYISIGASLFVCGSGGILAFLGYKSGKVAIQNNSKFVTQVARSMSDSNYSLQSVESYFDPYYRKEPQRTQLMEVFRTYREKLGRFEHL
ncbi:MAG TPA: hypothetical protein VK171_03070, partial [Fimbriimonas sp.]|nr:hypothetical protein [Fimbriimonas sp.]